LYPSPLTKRWRLRTASNNKRIIPAPAACHRVTQSATQKGPQLSSLKLLSFNIHAGTTTEKYRHYLTRGWRQMLPHTDRIQNLDIISELVSEYDIVGLQEVDSGSLRSGFVNQTKYLAHHAGFPYWSHQSNRKVGTFAYAGNGLLSRYEPLEIVNHKLPGAFPGRGALLITYGQGPDRLAVALLHLALGRKARAIQLEYVSGLLQEFKHCLVLGDLNAATDSPELEEFIGQLELQTPTAGLLSFPSWQPQRAIDHILVSNSLQVTGQAVIDIDCSDHCPVAVTVELPGALAGLSAIQDVHAVG